MRAERERERGGGGERDTAYFSFHEARETVDAIIMDLVHCICIKKKERSKTEATVRVCVISKQRVSVESMRFASQTRFSMVIHC